MNTVATRALLVVGGDAAARLFGFLAIVHFGRVLAPQHFGYVIIGMTTLQYAALAADLGLSTVGMRETARPAVERRFFFGTILSVRLVLAAIVTLLYEGALFVGFSTHPSYPVLALYGLSVLPTALLTEWYYQGKKILAPVALARFIGGALYIAFVYASVRSSNDAAVVPLAFAAGTLLTALLLLAYRWLRVRDQALPPYKHFRGVSELLQQSASVSAGSFFAQTVQLIPPLAAGWLLSAVEAGRYGAAIKLLGLALMLDRVFSIVFMPAVARSWHANRAELSTLVQRALRVIVVAGCAISAVCAIVADSLIVRVYGAEFIAAGSVFAVLSWFFALTMMNSVFTFSLIGAGHDRQYLRAGVWGGIISALLIVAGTAAAGVVGTAAAVVLAEAVITALTYRAFRQHFHVTITGAMLATPVMAVLYVLLCITLGLQQWWLAPALLAVFIGLALLCRLISVHDILSLLRR